MPNPRMGIKSEYDYLNVNDIEGASPKKIMGVNCLRDNFIVYWSASRAQAIEDRINEHRCSN